MFPLADEVTVAFDFSIKGPGIAIAQKGKKTLLLSPTEHIKTNITLESKNFILSMLPNNNVRNHKIKVIEDYFPRLVHNAEFVFNIVKQLLKTYEYKKITFAIEGYSFSASGRTHDIAECTGIFKYLIKKEYDEEFVLIPPTSIKKFTTDKGNCGKDVMVDKICSDNAELKKLFEVMVQKMSLQKRKTKKKSKKNQLYESPINDLVDAYALLLMIQTNK